MRCKTIDEFEFTSEENTIGFWMSAGELPNDLIEAMLVDGSQIDYYTPLHLEKDGLFTGLRQHQPRTAKLLTEGGALILRASKIPTMAVGPVESWVLNFGLEVNRQMVMIERGFYGMHPADTTFHQNKPGAELLRALPEPLREAYYTTFDGMKLPERPTVSVYGRFLPRNTNNWTLWDQYLGQFRGYKKKYIPWLIEKLPETQPKKPSKYGFFDFRCMLESVPDENGMVDFLWVKSFCEDGTVYHIRGNDVENMRILTNPAQAIDGYCDHVLSRKEGNFNFLPFTEPM
ncbi:MULTISPECIES: hypothetical protein [unclassified Rhizobium]|uniref:hypothetical protein n=1 Tax=unclassified Rhizobium TaxID=2613769 RepID=UPI0017813AAF|nr:MULTISPECIES: hypothetical protein [unclassified Rhizobium]MBD8688402.1 hypothetical protein [Rhizobium sp. CFBP 13644]MBD8693097.1 hypothetical protein [Rhizobium sp. CFBP 13717]